MNIEYCEVEILEPNQPLRLNHILRKKIDLIPVEIRMNMTSKGIVMGY